nr:lipid-A-disaccharide synthase-related protein [Crocosphaera sp.]
ERWLGSMYFPWERWLMTRLACRGVFVRDSLTAQILRRWSISVYDLGNPMMDHFIVNPSPTFPSDSEPLIILLLPGSRMPEAQHNWQLILQGVQSLREALSERSLLCLAAITPSFNTVPFQEDLSDQGWTKTVNYPENLAIADPQAISFTQGHATVILTQQAYQTCLQLAHVGLAMAGTATEQFVGLGKPVITFPGNGPQFTRKFAQDQTRLLGCSVILVDTPQQVGNSLTQLMSDAQQLQTITKNGQQRLGLPGAAERIAHCLMNECFSGETRHLQP